MGGGQGRSRGVVHIFASSKIDARRRNTYIQCAPIRIRSNNNTLIYINTSASYTLTHTHVCDLMLDSFSELFYTTKYQCDSPGSCIDATSSVVQQQDATRGFTGRPNFTPKGWDSIIHYDVIVFKNSVAPFGVFTRLHVYSQVADLI